MARSDGDESYHDGDGHETSDDERSSDNDNHQVDDVKAAESGSTSAAAAAAGVTSESSKAEFRPLSRTKPRKKKSYDAAAPEDLLPTFARKTERGGYAHTNQTKSRISQANTGNTPWNKGRNRSSADRAKIAAGVRARNRAILLEKLKRLGLSEEEWYAKKKEIKYLRERVRRAKVSAKRQEQAEAERNLQAVIDATTEKCGTGKNTAAKKMDPRLLASVVQSSDEPVVRLTTDESRLDSPVSTPDNEEKEPGLDEAGDIFATEVDFRPYSFGPNEESYDHACPTGGPGGLVCCEDCAKKYSRYLSNTVKDMEMYRTTRNGREVEELLTFLQEGRKTLGNAFSVAQRKIPPLPKIPTVAGRVSGGTSTVNKRPAMAALSEVRQWNITSSIDIGKAINASQMEMV